MHNIGTICYESYNQIIFVLITSKEMKLLIIFVQQQKKTS
jgi:hypothetical protein